MPPISDLIRGAFDRFITSIKTRLGIVKIYRVYMYVVRVSGVVYPPQDFRKKSPSRDTAIQFELSFEDAPYFRTLTENYRVAEKRFDGELRSLVTEQEVASRSVKSEAFGELGAFSWRKDEPAPTGKTLRDYLNIISDTEKERVMRTGMIKIPARPEFYIDTINFEPVDFIDVPSDRIKEFKSTDTFIFKIYRAGDTPEEAFNSWRDEFTHDLA